MFKGMPRKPGRLQVDQPAGKEIIRRDFDAEEWGYEWVKRNGVEVLRLLHDRDPEATDSFDFVEFSTPVSVSFVFDA